MTPAEYIATQPEDRQEILTALHEVILKHDASVSPIVEPMMGADMIIYKEDGKVMKYALASGKKHLSLHCLPMYMNAPVHSKYSALLPRAKFQKGCINFTSADELQPAIAAQLIDDCAQINITAILEARKKKR
ncbi:hypothetical protein C8P68_102302 [Mucilaginibacter yixingensis]|uniref:Uncharacterized protein n=1 Tax=Mucilaginibacter yixingensis TaxID=1295612 RepID=A0A2T5JCI3_9SPHI|nr:DUF1801 domain-containing protein [Mucilaginibacter yixingensis]PTQ99478.1 hypothetical protein C8P68_102302 [Mucilaginibacter yixingensis]